MPDIGLLAELAAFFDVGIPEIIKGERKRADMNDEAKEIAETMSDYATAEKEQLVKSIRNLSIIGLIAFVVYMLLGKTGVYGKNSFFLCCYKISEALIYAAVVMFPFYTTGLLGRLRLKGAHPKFGGLPKPLLKVIGFIVIFAAAALIRILVSKTLG